MRYLIIIACLMIVSCNNRHAPKQDTAPVDSQATTNMPLVDTAIAVTKATSPSKLDSLVWYYIVHTKAIDEKAKKDITWIHDNAVETDSFNYVVTRVGHSFEHHYVTDVWLYVDTNRSKLYEYDVAGDSLRRWGY